MAQTGVSGPVVVDEGSFLDALFAPAGQGPRFNVKTEILE